MFPKKETKPVFIFLYLNSNFYIPSLKKEKKSIQVGMKKSNM